MTLFHVLASRGGWYDFVVPYIFYAQVTNPDSMVEVMVDDLEVLEKEYSRELDFLSRNFKDKYLIRSIEKPIDDNHFRLIRNALRFLEEPKIKREYTYIGDIDVMVTEEVSSYHLAEMDRTGLPFSNQVKTDNGYDMLTGLHFYKTDAYIDIYPELDRYYSLLPRFRCDQQLLFHMMADKFSIDKKLITKKRPIHGIHMSQSRPNALAKDFGWNINKSTVEGYDTIKRHPLWGEFRSVVSDNYKKRLEQLEGFINEFQDNH
jgi:hypothetical protein